MDHTEYGLGVTTRRSVAEAEAAIRSALAEQGFGVLTEIDVAATMKAKLGLERPPYKILGACNPVLASRALGVDTHIGLLLPCNVIVYEGEDGTRVEAMEPEIMVRMVPDPAMAPIAAEARARLIAALAAVAD